MVKYKIKTGVKGFVFIVGNWRRFGFTPAEEEEMKGLFIETSGYPSKWQRQELAARFGYTEKKVYNWFHIRRKCNKNCC